MKEKPKALIAERKQALKDAEALVLAYAKDALEDFYRDCKIDHYFKMMAGNEIAKLLRAANRLTTKRPARSSRKART